MADAAAGPAAGPAPDAGRGPARRRRPPRALLEAVLIVFSVLLAFALNEFGQARAQRARAARALDAVRRELVANRAAVEHARRNHLRTVALVTHFESRRQVVPESVYFGRRGMFNPARQLASAWESARDAGVLAHLPYDLVLELSGVYADQARYATMSTSVAQDLYSDMVRRGVPAVFRDGAPNFAVLAADWAAREGVLIADCDSAIAQIDAARRRGAAPGAAASR